ncbi:hypothetical protein OROGR_015065 [Orobanche gracilis]
MSEDVWLTCMTHAFSTEIEEIMGLLLGDTQTSNNGNVTPLIWGALPQPRSDGQKDRDGAKGGLAVAYGAEYIRKEIPLHVLLTSSLLSLDSPLTSFTNLQRLLYEEGKTAYNHAIGQNTRWQIVTAYSHYIYSAFPISVH